MAGKLIVSCPHSGNSNNQILGNHFYPFHLAMPFSRILAVGNGKLVHRKLLIGVVPVNDRIRQKIGWEVHLVLCGYVTATCIIK